MILLDANLLIYAVDASSPHHARAHAWIGAALSGEEPVGLSWMVVLAFLRVITNARALAKPLTVEAAVGVVDAFLGRSVVQLVDSGPGHWNALRSLLVASGTAGNLTGDAHLAALAIEQGAILCSADYDFRRFPGIRHVNPLADA